MAREETFLIMPNKIWCSGTPENFSCLNGAWSGKFKDGKVYVTGREDVLTGCEIVWRGVVPARFAGYNQAIPWILEQVAANR